MKVILNKDLATLGEEGDVKDVAKGYARNYLFPRGIALPYTPSMIKVIEGRRSDIEKRKEQKRQDALGIKEKLEAVELSIEMPAGANGRLYGAVTSQTIADELAKSGLQIERKKIEIPGSGLKTVGKYKVIVKLYENQSVEVTFSIIAKEIKIETPVRQSGAVRPARRGRREERRQDDNTAENSAEKIGVSEQSDAKENKTTQTNTEPSDIST